MQKYSQPSRYSIIFTLIIAGETIFFLPFVLARIFRPTLLVVFGITNSELGAYFSVYGVVAMISYLFGGPLADRFSARILMSLALWFTSIGGFVMATLPPSRIMIFLYAFWGFTTICLFWAAMIRVTREWGGANYQGRAFGWLEGGRGTIAALLGTLTFLLFTWIAPGSGSAGSEGSGIHAFQWVVLATSGFTMITGFLVWFFIPHAQSDISSEPGRQALRRVYSLMRKPSVWLLAIMIICAYAGYKITDDFSLYAREVLGFSEISSAGVATGALWLRALVAILAGFLADRLRTVNVIIVCFALTLGTGLLTSLGILDQVAGLVLLNLMLTATGIYGVRALYFAMMSETNIVLGSTGAAVGIISFIGFTPDVFMSPWMGYLLDKYPGPEGHHFVFLVLALFGLIGLITGLILLRINRQG